MPPQAMSLRTEDRVRRFGRRRALAALVALGVGAIAGEGMAASEPRAPTGKRLRSVQRGKGPTGTTLIFDLPAAPFASPSKYDDGTVLVYVPAHYRLPKARTVDVLVHFHGHHTTAERATFGHVLREQLDDSKQNAILVVPQLAVMAADSSAGRLEAPDGLERLLAEVIREVRRDAVGRELGKSSLAGARGPGKVCLSAHSGGYNAAAHCLAHGGVKVRECWLFDALYGQVDVFRRWVLAGGRSKKDRHKLMSFYAGGEVTKNNLALYRSLRDGGIDCRHEKKPGELSRADLVRGHAVFIRATVSHGETAFVQNNLRDCLYASTFQRFRKSDWFGDKDEPRAIDRRKGR